MNILLDFITLKWQTGAGEYARRVYRELLTAIEEKQIADVCVYALYDSKEGIAYKDMREDSMTNMEFIDISIKPLSLLVQELHIDTFFIACAQYLGGYADLSNVSCRTISVIHDLGYEEMYSNSMYYYFKLINPKYELGDLGVRKIKYWLNTLKIVKWFIDVRRKRNFESWMQLLYPILEMVKTNKNVQLITVSNFTCNSLFYYYNVNKEQVKVLSSPERIYNAERIEVGNEELKELIANGKRYYLMVSANRNTKNPNKAVKAFRRFAETDMTAYFVVVGYPSKEFDRMINVPYLSDSDLSVAFKNCYAFIYPSFFEGFGYPPLEAMHYGKPVLASNATSIPEILGEAPIYFSPLYETEIFNALTKLTDENYEIYSEKSRQQYVQVHARQELDLQRIINMILEIE